MSLLTGVPKISRARLYRTGCRAATIRRTGSNACASAFSPQGSSGLRPQQAVDGLHTFHAKIDDERIGAKVASRRRDGPQPDEDLMAFVGFGRDADGDAGWAPTQSRRARGQRRGAVPADVRRGREEVPARARLARADLKPCVRPVRAHAERRECAVPPAFVFPVADSGSVEWP